MGAIGVFVATHEPHEMKTMPWILHLCASTGTWYTTIALRSPRMAAPFPGKRISGKKGIIGGLVVSRPVVTEQVWLAYCGLHVAAKLKGVPQMGR
jgi:hypothetical protein